MYRIDNATAITPRPAPAAVGPNPNYFFTKGNPALSIPATIVDDDWANAVQEEVCGVITGAGMTLNKTSITQLLDAIKAHIQAGAGVYWTDTGAANAYVITPSPAIAAYAGGQTFKMVPTHVNTGASTINVNGLGTKQIVHADGSALQAGDIPATGVIEITYQAGIGKFLLTSFVPAPFNNTSNGYFRIPGTPFIVQWGPIAATTSASPGPGLAFYTGVVSVTFGLAFPNGCLAIVGTAYDISVRSGEIFHVGGLPNTTGFTGYLECDQASTAMSGNWIAIGY